MVRTRSSNTVHNEWAVDLTQDYSSVRWYGPFIRLAHMLGVCCFSCYYFAAPLPILMVAKLALTLLIVAKSLLLKPLPGKDQKCWRSGSNRCQKRACASHWRRVWYLEPKWLRRSYGHEGRGACLVPAPMWARYPECGSA